MQILRAGNNDTLRTEIAHFIKAMHERTQTELVSGFYLNDDYLVDVKFSLPTVDGYVGVAQDKAITWLLNLEENYWAEKRLGSGLEHLEN